MSLSPPARRGSTRGAREGGCAYFACVKARLVIEVDGPSHWTDEGMAEDERRTQYLQQSGWRELRVCNDDIYRNLDNVIAEILNQVKR